MLVNNIIIFGHRILDKFVVNIDPASVIRDNMFQTRLTKQSPLKERLRQGSLAFNCAIKKGIGSRSNQISQYKIINFLSYILIFSNRGNCFN
jgi:hypothetical protein